MTTEATVRRARMTQAQVDAFFTRMAVVSLKLEAAREEAKQLLLNMGSNGSTTFKKHLVNERRIDRAIARRNRLEAQYESMGLRADELIRRQNACEPA
jgi:hypothetical protein